MSDIEKARQLFQDAGLPFPKIPEELATRMREQERWVFSTREIKIWPYNLEDYVHETDSTHAEDYVVLSHSGHGVNSYALQYYLVHGRLEMFLHLGWGGVYMDAERSAARVRDCFSLADEIVSAAQTVGDLQTWLRLRIVGSDFYGSYWFVHGEKECENSAAFKDPVRVLKEALHWLQQN